MGKVLKICAAGVICLFSVCLMPIIVHGIDIDVEIGAYGYYTLYRDAEIGWTIEGSVLVTEGDMIEFFICDDENFDYWISNNTAFLHDHIKKTSGHLFSFNISHDAKWYVVFSNIDSFAVKHVQVEVNFVDDLGMKLEDINQSFYSPYANPLIPVSIILIACVFLIGIWLVRRRGPVPAVRYDDILDNPAL